MADGGRRTAGTMTMTDTLRRLFGAPVTPERDLADLRAGHALRVVAFRHDGRWRQGAFVLDIDGQHPLTWARWPRGAAEPLDPGAWLRPATADAPRQIDARFVSVLVGTDRGALVHSVPRVDLPVLTEAFRLAGARPA